MFSDEFGKALALADRVVITDVYGSRETPIPGINGELVVDAARSNGAVVDYVPHRSELAEFLSERVGRGDLVITMGAGDITLVPTELARLLSEKQ
jgi:UDP-N-acetylmuramate--alanine ligase